MKPLPNLILAACVAGMAGCGSSSSPAPTSEIVAARVIGPDGGTLEVTSGAQAGVKVTVPPGALLVPTEFRIVDTSLSLPPELRATSYAPLLSLPFRIEPDDLMVTEDVTLQLPYRPSRVYETAQSNVRARQSSAFSTADRMPDWVDTSGGLLRVRVREFGAFLVVAGPLVYDMTDYVPPVDEVIALDGGYTFVVEDAASSSAFVGDRLRRWRIEGPGFEEALYFDGRKMIGRETADWREVWNNGFDVFQRPRIESSSGVREWMQVESPIGGATTIGQVLAISDNEFADPERVGERLVLDVLRLTIDVSFERTDLGVGTRQYSFWLSPDDGLFAIAIDGVRRARQR